MGRSDKWVLIITWVKSVENSIAVLKLLIELVETTAHALTVEIIELLKIGKD